MGEREGFQAPISYDTPVADEKIAIDDYTATTKEIKKVAKFFGADLCGVTDYDKR